MHANVDRPPRPPLHVIAEEPDAREPVLSPDVLVTVVAGTAIGAALAVFVVPAVVPDMASSLLGAQPNAYWYLSRASGVVAYLLLWFASVLGLVQTNRVARPWCGGPAVASLQQFVSLLGLAFLAFHVAVLLGDRHLNYRLDQLLVPFASSYEPLWIGLGQVAGYIALAIAFSFAVRRFIGVRCWRLIHYVSVAVVALSVAHSLGAGTDSATPLMAAVYIVTCSVTVFLTVYRVVRAAASYGRQ